MEDKQSMMNTELSRLGNTPLVQYEYDNHKIFLKMENANPSGSMKDRAAANIIGSTYKNGVINDDTRIIESSSGNFGVALARVCKEYRLKFTCVIDANINIVNERMLRLYGAETIKITEPDNNGGYLLGRLEKVREIISKSKNIYWTNQYENPLNMESYYSLADEIINDISDPDYIFIPVSSGGAITGISRRIKEINPRIKIIAVDSIGSRIFNCSVQKRCIPGLGSSIVPPILKMAKIDDVVQVKEEDIIQECHDFFEQNSMMIGGSSGATLQAVKWYRRLRKLSNNSKIVAIFPDCGDRYINTIYNEKWCKSNIKPKEICSVNNA